MPYNKGLFTCASAMFASNVPCTLDSSAILSLVDRGTTTTRLKFVDGVKALKISGETVHAINGARRETCRTAGSRVRLVLGTFPIVSVVGRPGLGAVTLAAVGFRGPIPVLRALGSRVITRARIVRNTAVLLLAPRPTRGRALLFWWGRRVRTRSKVRRRV